MPSLDSEYVELTRRDIAGSGLGSDPKTIAAFESLQNAAFRNNPAAAEAAQETATDAAAAAAAADANAAAAAAAAALADASAATAQGAADTAAATAATAQARADGAYALAETKVEMSAGPAWAAPSGTATRAAYAAYTAPVVSNPPTQAEMQALADAVQALSRAMVALVTDLRANEALTP
jgi:hypothetical protein